MPFQVFATDPENDEITYVNISEPNFRLNGNHLLTNVLLNYEAQPQYVFTIRARDNGSLPRYGYAQVRTSTCILYIHSVLKVLRIYCIIHWKVGFLIPPNNSILFDLLPPSSFIHVLLPSMSCYPHPVVCYRPSSLVTPIPTCYLHPMCTSTHTTEVDVDMG